MSREEVRLVEWGTVVVVTMWPSGAKGQPGPPAAAVGWPRRVSGRMAGAKDRTGAPAPPATATRTARRFDTGTDTQLLGPRGPLVKTQLLRGFGSQGQLDRQLRRASRRLAIRAGAPLAMKAPPTSRHRWE